MSEVLDYVRQSVQSFELKHGRLPDTADEIAAVKAEAKLALLIDMGAEDPTPEPEISQLGIDWKQA